MLTSRRGDPTEPALQILDAVIDVARAQLLAHHPPVDTLVLHDAPFDAVDFVARMLVARLDELRDLADAYRRAVTDVTGPGIF